MNDDDVSSGEPDSEPTNVPEPYSALIPRPNDPPEPAPGKPKIPQRPQPDPGPSCPEVDFDPCAPFGPHVLPSLPLQFSLSVGSLPKPWSQIESLSAACIRLTDAVLTVDASAVIEQRWNLQRLAKGDVSAVMSLAPAEELKFRLLRSQRTQLDTTTMSSKEAMRSFESNISDKEVLEAARTMTNNQGWSVSANAGASMGGATAGVSVGYQASVQNTVSSKFNQIREATEKAGSQLRHLNKTEVVSTAETGFTDERTRTVSNPYRDRSLSLVVYDVLKQYCVEQEVVGVFPVLALSASNLQFDREFVLSNLDFLLIECLDKSLGGELQDALQQARTTTEAEDHTLLVESRAESALRHLYEEDDILEIGPLPAPLPFPVTMPEDDPAGSFEEPHRDNSGWHDARANRAADVFLLLASFRRLAMQNGHVGSSPTPGGIRLSARELAIALHSELKVAWEEVEYGNRKDLYDWEDRGAVFRRIPAFLAIMERLVKPFLDSQAEAPDGRLNLVLNRCVQHLACFAGYYAERFHAYMFARTRGAAHRELVTNAIEASGLGSRRAEFLRDFDLGRLRVDGTTVFVPYTGADPEAVLSEYFPDSLDVPSGRIVFQVDLPADGSQIEAVPGDCVLTDLPPGAPIEDEA